jgi:hypothetical protein
MVRVNVLAVQVSSGQEEGHFYAWCFLRIVNVRIYYLIECTIVKILVTIFMLRYNVTYFHQIQCKLSRMVAAYSVYCQSVNTLHLWWCDCDR